jgi:hypothetical protein
MLVAWCISDKTNLLEIPKIDQKISYDVNKVGQVIESAHEDSMKNFVLVVRQFFQCPDSYGKFRHTQPFIPDPAPKTKTFFEKLNSLFEPKKIPILTCVYYSNMPMNLTESINEFNQRSDLPNEYKGSLYKN